MMLRGMICRSVFRVTRGSTRRADDKSSSGFEQSSHLRKAAAAGIINQAMQTTAINNELKRGILTLVDITDMTDKKVC